MSFLKNEYPIGEDKKFSQILLNFPLFHAPLRITFLRISVIFSQDEFHRGPGDLEYFFSENERLNFKEAVEACKAKEARLVVPGDLATNNWIFDKIRSKNMREAWIGITDIWREGKWLTSDGMTPTVLIWNYGEPNNMANEDCAEIGHRGGKMWNDISCYSKYPYVCERPKSKW